MFIDSLWIIIFIYILCSHLSGGTIQNKLLSIREAPKTRFRDSLIEKCPALTQDKFLPVQWAPYSLIQTSLTYTMRRFTIKDTVCIRRDIIASHTLDTLALDWIERSDIVPHQKSPIVINFSGVSNCSTTCGFGAMILSTIQDHYAEINNVSVRTLNVIYSGFNGHVLDSNKVPGSCYLSTDTVGIVLRHVKSLYPDAKLIIVGWSYGSALISSWLSRNAEESETFNIELVLLYAYGHSIQQTVDASDNIWCGIVSKVVVGVWKSQMFDNEQNFEQLKRLEKAYPRFSIKNLKNAKTVFEWDKACLPLYNFESIEDMYEKADPARKFNNINKKINIVIINADDDWICPSERIKTISDTMPNVAIIETNGGGHLAWIDNMDIKTYIKKTLNICESRRESHSRWLIQLTLQLVSGFI